MRWAAYRNGAEAYGIVKDSGCEVDNPYPDISDDWKSWNKGWNE